MHHQEHRRGAHLPCVGRWARKWINFWVRDARPVQTYGYLPSRRASSPFSRYQFILLGEERQYNDCVYNLPIVVIWQCPGSESNLQPQGCKFGTLPLHPTLRRTEGGKKFFLPSLYRRSARLCWTLTIPRYLYNVQYRANTNGEMHVGCRIYGKALRFLKLESSRQLTVKI